MEDQHNVDASCEISKDTTFYCLVDHVVLGPFTVPQLKQRMELGMIDGMTYCWTQGMPQWSIIADIPTLKDCLIQDQVVQENDIISSEALQLSISSKLSNVEPKKRIPLEEIPMELKFISPEGIGKIFDLVTHQWVDFATYIKLLDAETHDPTPKDSTVDIQDPLTVDFKTKKKRNCENRQKYRQRLRKRQEQGDWINAKSNPNVYVKGLPPDVTEDQLNDIFKRAGVIKIDPETCRPKIRLYRDEQGALNGDALLSFVHEDSVPIALKFLNGMEIKPNYSLQIEQAQFNLSRKSNHLALSPKRPQQRKKYLAAKLQQQRLMTWDDTTTDGRIKIMILKPLWSFAEAKRYPLGDPFYKSIATQLNDFLSSWIHIVSVTPIDRHPLGIVCVKFRTVELCEAAVARLNERPYHLLDLPNREVELAAQFFREKEPSLSQECIESFHQQAPINERFNKENLDLLYRLDIFLEAEKLCKSLKTNHEEHKEQDMSEDVNSCFSYADINAVEPSLLTQLNHQDFNWSILEINTSSVPPHLVERFQQWKRLAYFIFQYPLTIEAYIYDGKTNLKDQCLPSCTEDKRENKQDTKEQDSSRDEDENNLNDRPSTDRDKSWQDWLVGDDDDSDSSEFMIRTEQ